jgi:DNA-binding transcriptional LysR family regulator
MEIRQIRYAVSVARHLHFTKAAQELFVAQPALSYQIKQLEIELGVQLFDRSTRHVTLTDAGRAFLPSARRILAELDDIHEKVSDTIGLERGLVQLGAQQSVTACGALPHLLMDFHRLHPGVDVVMQEESADEALKLLRERKLDLALAQIEPHHQSQALTHELLYHEEMAMVVGPDSSLLHSVRRLRDLTTENFLAFNKTAALHRLLLRVCIDAGFQPRIGYESPSLASIRAMASAGLGVAFLPLPSVLAPGPAVRRLEIAGLPTRPISLVRGKDRYQSFAAASLAEQLHQNLAKAVPGLSHHTAGS